jgi:transposase-like protein
MKESLLKELVNRNLTIRAIAKETGLSPTSVRYWLDKFELKTSGGAAESGSTCKQCGAELSGKQTKFCSKKCKNAKHARWENIRESMQARRIARKIHFVKLLGGKCDCGYDKNLACLDFHHIDPTIKLFELSVNAMSSKSMKELESEAKKCKLVCRNCHGEIHQPHLSNWKNGGQGGI